MKVDVLIAGAGPAGLAAAVELRRAGVGRVLVVDREAAPGGVPRHCAHTGYGLRDLHRMLTGPAYARQYADAAAAAGAEVRAGSTVTGWAGTGSTGTGSTGTGSTGNHAVTVTSAQGIETVEAAAVLLTTGCRERPRAARLVAGGRPPGVMTTGELQQRVFLGGQRLPGRAVIVGAEHVSFSALVTLAHAGAEVVALVTEHPKHQSYPAFLAAARLRWHVPVWTSAVVRRVVGQDRLAGVEVADVRGGAARFVRCDTLVFTGDWIPDHELARLGGLAIDPGTRGPVVDTTLQTSVPLVFAAGNLVHAAETADVAALGGRHAARHIAAALAGPPPAAWPRVPVTVTPPLSWISPNAIRAMAALPSGALGPAAQPPRGRFLLRCGEFRPAERIEVGQDGRLLARSRPVALVPGRPVHLAAGWVGQVDPAGGPVQVALAGSRAPGTGALPPGPGAPGGLARGRMEA
jgi:thioredoxin reductase